MRITREAVQKPKPAFEPFTVTLTVESKEDFAVLWALANASMRIPDLLVYNDPWKRTRGTGSGMGNSVASHENLERFLTELHRNLWQSK